MTVVSSVAGLHSFAELQVVGGLRRRGQSAVGNGGCYNADYEIAQRDKLTDRVPAQKGPTLCFTTWIAPDYPVRRGVQAWARTSRELPCPLG